MLPHRRGTVVSAAVIGAEQARVHLADHLSPRAGGTGLLCYTSEVITCGRIGSAAAGFSPSGQDRIAINLYDAAAHSALSIEGWDFEEEKSLDQRQCSLGGRRRAGRLWQYHLLCRPRVAAQRAGQPRPDRHPEPRRLGQGSARRSSTPTTTGAAATTAHRPPFPSPAIAAQCPSASRACPRNRLGAVYGFGDGSFTLASYAQEKTTGTVSGLNGLSSSIFITRNQSYVFAASQASHVLTVVNQAIGGSYALGLPGVYRVSVNPGGSVALAFVQNSNYAYYPVQLTAAQSIAYSGGPSHLAQGRRRLRTAERARMVPLSDAKSRQSGPEISRLVLRRSADLRPSGQGRLLVRWQHRLYPQLRTRVRGNHIVLYTRSRLRP